MSIQKVKNKKTPLRLILLAIPIFFAGLLIIGCSAPDGSTETFDSLKGGEDGGDGDGDGGGLYIEPSAMEAPLLGGQSIDVGTFSVWIDVGTVYFKFESRNGWVMAQNYLAVAPSLEVIPQTQTGNPIPDHFPYISSHDIPVTEITYALSSQELGCVPGSELYIAAYAEVRLMATDGTVLQEEGAWADGPGFPGANWATFLVFVP